MGKIQQFFDFLEKKEGRKKPFEYKLIHEPDNLTPEELDVEGDLDLDGSKITSLPQGLKVEGDLDLEDTPITSLPEGLKVGGSLFLRDTLITSLPQGLQVGGSLNLYYTPLSEKYTKEEIRKMCPGVRGKIYM
jgi:hypothetical protein